MALTNPFQITYHTDFDDQDLIAQTLGGDKEALEKLVKKHQPYIYNIAWKMVRCPEDAADMTQEVLVKVITKLSTFKGTSSFRTWLYRIVVNDFLQMKRRGHEYETVDFENHSSGLANFADQELTELEKEEYKAEEHQIMVGCMSGMLLCLSREQRIVYILADLFKADHNIGAEILGISPGNYRVKVSRARKDLSNYMNKQCGLLNPDNPCRCHKKVKAALDMQIMDRKNLFANKKDLKRFNDYVASDAVGVFDLLEDKATELFSKHPRETEFDKKGFLEGVLADKEIISLLNLDLN